MKEVTVQSREMEEGEGKKTTTSQASQEEVFGGVGDVGVGITKRPKTDDDGEASVGTKRPRQAEGEVVAPTAGVKHLEAEGQVVPGAASSGLADDSLSDDGTIIGGAVVETGAVSEESSTKYAA
jgi:hypothetical protein